MTHWRYGRLSGYPICCIVWFNLRLILISLVGLERVAALDLKLVTDKSHILCPVHVLLALLGFKPRYSVCSECGWEQLGVPPCKVKDLHKTWVVEDIRKGYTWQLKRFGFILVGQRGKLGKQLRKEVESSSFHGTTPRH